MKRIITPASSISGTPLIPGDKSISHRALILGALSSGETRIHNILRSADVFATGDCLARLGVKILDDHVVTIKGTGTEAFTCREQTLNCQNSGTSMRLFMGMLSGERGAPVTLIGDESLRARPMKRVAEPLRKMGAKISLSEGDHAPVIIESGPLHGIEYEVPVASAQIKSALILAALRAEGETVLTGKIRSRDHTERMIQDFGGVIHIEDGFIRVPGGQTLTGAEVYVPGDPSTAAFWIAAASIIPGSHVRLKDISLNPTRLGFVRALKSMGASIEMEATRYGSDPVGTIDVRYAPLSGIQVNQADIPAMIDEIPLLALVAAFASGETSLSGAEELRVKESDRLKALEVNFERFGIEGTFSKDGFSVIGPQSFKGGVIESFGDHRILMCFSIAGLASKEGAVVENSDSAQISYPGFFEHLDYLRDQ